MTWFLRLQLKKKLKAIAKNYGVKFSAFALAFGVLLFLPMSASAEEITEPLYYNPSVVVWYDDSDTSNDGFDVNAVTLSPTVNAWMITPSFPSSAPNKIGYLSSAIVSRRLSGEDSFCVRIGGIYDTTIANGYSFPTFRLTFTDHQYTPQDPLTCSAALSAVLTTGLDGSDVVEYHRYYWSFDYNSTIPEWEYLIAEATQGLRDSGYITSDEQILAITDITARYFVYDSLGFSPVDREWSPRFEIEYPLFTRAVLRYTNVSLRVNNAYNDGYSKGFEVGENNGFESGYDEGYRDGEAISDFSGVDWLLNIFDALLSFELLRFGDASLSIGTVIGTVLFVPLVIWFLKLFAGG